MVIWCINFILCLIIIIEWLEVKFNKIELIFFVFLLVKLVIGLFINNRFGDWVINIFIFKCCFLLWDKKVVLIFVFLIKFMIFNKLVIFLIFVVGILWNKVVIIFLWWLIIKFKFFLIVKLIYIFGVWNLCFIFI